MYYGLIESKLFIILTKYISSEMSESQDSIFGGFGFGYFVIGVILREKCIHLRQKNALKNQWGLDGTRWLWYNT